MLVTGGTGFLGGRLVERLLQSGRTVRILARTPAPAWQARGVQVVSASLSDAAAIARACEGVGTVFHVAAKVGVWGKYQQFYDTNVVGTRNILAACRKAGVRRLVHTSTPSVVYSGGDIRGADETLPLTRDCPSPYPTTKAQAEKEVLAANSPELRTVSLRPHLVWGPGDPHLVPRLIARHSRLRIIGSGTNRVDMVHVENAVDAHLLAERSAEGPAAGKAYFITNGEPVVLWDWINALFSGVGLSPVTRRVSLPAATAAGALLEGLWRVFPLSGEPPLTRFVAAELAKDHWFCIDAARRDLGYEPRISMEEGTRDLVRILNERRAGARPRTA